MTLKTPISALSNEILFTIFDYFQDDPRTAASIVKTNKLWNQVMIHVLKTSYEKWAETIREHFMRSARIEIMPSASYFSACTTLHSLIKTQKAYEQRIFTKLSEWPQKQSPEAIKNANAQTVQPPYLEAFSLTLDGTIPPSSPPILRAIRSLALYYILAKKEEMTEESLKEIQRGICDALCHNHFPLALSLFEKASTHPLFSEEIEEKLNLSFAMAYVDSNKNVEAQSWLKKLHQYKESGLTQCAEICASHHRSQKVVFFLNQLSIHMKTRLLKKYATLAAQQGYREEMEYFLTSIALASRSTKRDAAQHALETRLLLLAHQGNSTQLTEMLRMHHITKTEIWIRTTDIDAIQKFAQEFHTHPHNKIIQLYAPYIAHLGMLSEALKLVNTLPIEKQVYALANCMETYAIQGNVKNMLFLFERLSLAQHNTIDTSQPFTDNNKWDCLSKSITNMIEHSHAKNIPLLIALLPSEKRLSSITFSLKLCVSLNKTETLLHISTLWEECPEKATLLKECALNLAHNLQFTSALHIAQPWPDLCTQILERRHSLFGF